MIPDNQTLSSLNYKNPNGTVSVEVSAISADKAILTVKDFSFDNYEFMFSESMIRKPNFFY